MHLLIKAVFATSFLALVLGSAALAQQSVVATVGSKSITVEEFNRRYEEIKRQAVNPPPKKVFLEDLVRYEMGIQEAEKKNLAKDPQVAERIRQELYKGLVEKELGQRINAIVVSDSEMKDFYSENPEVRTSHILVEVKPSATAADRQAARKRAEEILSDVKKSNKPFEHLANLYSDDIATKKNGGDVGFQTRVTVVPTYYEASIKLKVGELSPVVETPYGFHIIKLTAKHSYADANKRQLRAAVFEKKRLALFNEYFEKVRRNYKVTLNLDAIK